MSQQDWEQIEPDGGEGVDAILERYLGNGATPADGSGPGPDATSGQDASGEGFDPVSQVVERVLEQLGSQLDQKLTSMRHDLQTYAERTAQSFSDKTASRLTQRQQEQMAMVERVLAPLRDQLGPDYDEAVRQAKLNVVLSGEAQDQGGGVPQAPAPQSAMGEPTHIPANAYLSQKLGAPSAWSEEDLAAIQSDLAQARDWTEWMAVVDKYAERRPIAAAQGRGPLGRTGNVARAQPVGTAAGKRPAPSLDQLDEAYNRAVAEGDIDAVSKLGAQIDAFTSTSR